MATYQQTVKMQNKLIVLRSIMANEPVSRAELSQILNLTKATVSSLVDELVEDKYCFQTGLGKSSGGRRPLMLQFNEQAGYAISFDIGVNYILGVLTDLEGAIVDETSLQFDTNDFTKTVMEITKLCDGFIQQISHAPYGLVGIGFGVPGLVNTDGDILITPNLDWGQSNLKEIFAERYSVPVIVENEANAGAYGEKAYGWAQNKENFIYVSAGIGIGVGLILDNRLFRGSDGFTGEMGHMIIQADGLHCRCGSSGCWEMYASEMALLNQFKQLRPHQQGMTLEGMINLAVNGDKEIQGIFHNIGKYLGIGINNIINTFNPEKIIIGNSLAKAEHLLEKSLEDVINNQTLAQLRGSVDISFGQKKRHATVLGLAAFMIEQFLEKQFQTSDKVSV